MNIQTRHYGMMSIAAMEIGKIVAGVCDESTIVESLNGGQIFAIVISVIDFAHRHFGKKQ